MYCTIAIRINSIHFFHMSSKHRLMGRKSSAQHDNGQRSTLDHHQTALGLHIVLRVQPTFRYGNLVLVKRCTSKTHLRLLINTKLVPSLFKWPTESRRTGETRIDGSLIPYIGLRWPYSVCLVWSWTLFFFLSPTTHCDTHYSSHRTKVLSLIKKEKVVQLSGRTFQSKAESQ